ncbi:MAG: Gfo/Idh/MocA family oxidoreductase, partial [Anaerolineae bacterium]|nr:Gfo/Idh/MocA family oxidoreductase [Anaerolineae bacterium]
MTESAKLRIVVIGAGMIANAGHIPAFRNLADEVEIVGVSSRDPARVAATAERHGIPQAYTSWRAMLADLQPDLAVVTTPNTSHAEITIAALESGADVLCEKPAAAAYADAQAMFAAARRTGRLLMIVQTGRYSAEIQAAKEWTDEGRLGEVYYAETSALRRRGVPQWGRFHMRADS